MATCQYVNSEEKSSTSDKYARYFAVSNINTGARNKMPRYSKVNSVVAKMSAKRGGLNLSTSNATARIYFYPESTYVSSDGVELGFWRNEVTTSYKEFSANITNYVLSQTTNAGEISSSAINNYPNLYFQVDATISKALYMNLMGVYWDYTPPTYTLSLSSSGGGSVSGGGTFDVTVADQTRTITATPNAGYRFVKWVDSNGNTYNTPSLGVVISQNSISAFSTKVTYTAYFELDKIYVTYDSIFNFRKWADTNLRSWTLMNVSNVTDVGFTGQALADDAYTEECRPLIPVQIGKEYTIEFDASGGGFECFVFNCDANGAWGSSNPMFTVQGNTKKFNFVPVTNYVSIRCDIVGTGTVVNFSNFRIYPSDCPYMSNTVSAEDRTDLNAWSMPTPSRNGYEFLGWYTQPNGGGTKYTSSSAFPTSDLVLYSHWGIQKHTVTFKNHDGTVLQTVSVEHGGTPKYTGSTPTKSSTAEYSYSFSGWSPSIGVITSDTTYTAQFTATKQKYTINTLATNGEASGGGTYEYGTSITLMASPADGYKFEKWSDGNTQNPRIITVTGDATYEAQFRQLILKFKTVKIYYPSENDIASPTNPLVSGDKAQIVVQVALE